MHENLVRIKAVANALAGIGQQFVFVGGATVSLYSTFPQAAEEVRPTDDVDVVVELASYAGYAKISERLLELGFSNDVESGVICRFRIQGVIVDVMPTEPETIGFSNKWYPEGFRHAVAHQLDEQTQVLIFSLPYFIASKWEAYKGRGKGNLRTSHDFEDIVYVLEHCHDFDEQIIAGPNQVRAYLSMEIAPLLERASFLEGINCHMQGAYQGDGASILIERLRNCLS